MDPRNVKLAQQLVSYSVKLQPGEYVEPDKPLFALVVANRPWVEANFKETELTHVRPGMEATVVLDIYPDVQWKAKIGSISPATGAVTCRTITRIRMPPPVPSPPRPSS